MKYFMSLILLLALALPARADHCCYKWIEPRVSVWNGRWWEDTFETYWITICHDDGAVTYYESHQVSPWVWRETEVFPDYDGEE